MKLATFSFKRMLLKNKPSSLGSNVRSLLLRGEAASRHSPLSLHSQLPWRLWAECQKFQLRFITERLPHQQTSGAPSLGSPRPHCPGLLWLYREDLQTVHKALPPIKEFHSPAWVIPLTGQQNEQNLSLTLSLSTMGVTQIWFRFVLRSVSKQGFLLTMMCCHSWGVLYVHCSDSRWLWEVSAGSTLTRLFPCSISSLPNTRQFFSPWANKQTWYYEILEGNPNTTFKQSLHRKIITGGNGISLKHAFVIMGWLRLLLSTYVTN